MDFNFFGKMQPQPNSDLDKIPKKSFLMLAAGSSPLSTTTGASVNDKSTEIEHQSSSQPPSKPDSNSRGPRLEGPSTQDERNLAFNFSSPDDIVKPDHKSMFEWKEPLPPKFAFLTTREAPRPKLVGEYSTILALLPKAVPLI